MDQIIEVSAAAHEQGVLDGFLEVAMRALDGAVLMRLATVVPGWLHPVVCAKRIVTPGQIDPAVGIEIAECGRKAVAAMRGRRTAERP